MFLPKELDKKLIDFDNFDGPSPTVTPDQKVYLRYFGGGAGFWLITHYDRANEIFWGYCNPFGGDEGEWGAVTRDELELTRSPRGIPPMAVERDCWFDPLPISKASAHAGRLLEWSESTTLKA